MTQLSWWTGGEAKKVAFPDVSIDVEMKNQLFRRISPGWRLFLTRKLFHFYGKQRTVLPRLRVARPAWDLIENLDAIQCDVPKRSSTNSQVNRHPRVFQNSPPFQATSAQKGGKKKKKQALGSDTDSERREEKKKRQHKKCADTRALLWFTRWASSPCVCIHIDIHPVLPESTPVVVFRREVAGLGWWCVWGGASEMAVIREAKWILATYLAADTAEDSLNGFSIKRRVIFVFLQTLINWDYIYFTRPTGQREKNTK